MSFDPEELIFISRDLLTETRANPLFNTQAVRTLKEDRRIQELVVQGHSIKARNQSG